MAKSGAWKPSALQAMAAQQGQPDAGVAGEEGLEERDLALPQQPQEERRRHLLVLGDLARERRGLDGRVGLAVAVADQVRDGLLERLVELALVDLEAGEDVLAQRRRDPPVHPSGQLGAQLRPAQQRVLVGVDSLRLLDEVFHRRARDVRADVLEQVPDDVVMPGLDQRVADRLRDVVAHRDGELMLERAVVNELDQLLVLQDGAAQQDGMGDFDVVVGQGAHQVARRRGLIRQALGQRAPHLDLDVVDELTKDVAHQRALAIVERPAVGAEQVRHHVDQRLSARDRFVARELEEVSRLEI